MSDIKWHVERQKISSLTNFSKNPRKLSRTQAQHLEKSIRKFGYIDEIIVNQDLTVICGHQRLRILKGLGFKEIDVRVPDRQLEPLEVKELCIRHNKNVGEWDWDILGNEWPVEELMEWGFDPKDLQIAEDEEEKSEKVKKCAKCDGEEDIKNVTLCKECR